MYSRLWLPMFVGLVRRHATVLITGGTGVGKTTLLKALLAQCDVNERIVTVEEVRELGELGRGDHVSLVTREANVEGVGAISLTDLVKATLRMRPDRVVLGECRGAEIVDLLRAFNSGHHGGMTTVHADGVNRVPSRLISLGLLAGVSPQALTMLAAGAFDAVVHLERVNGQRRITQIGELRVAHGELAGTPLAVWNGCHPPRYAAEWGHFIERWGIVPGPVVVGDDVVCCSGGARRADMAGEQVREAVSAGLPRACGRFRSHKRTSICRLTSRGRCAGDYVRHRAIARWRHIG